MKILLFSILLILTNTPAFSQNSGRVHINKANGIQLTTPTYWTNFEPLRPEKGEIFNFRFTDERWRYAETECVFTKTQYADKNEETDTLRYFLDKENQTVDVLSPAINMISEARSNRAQKFNGIYQVEKTFHSTDLNDSSPIREVIVSGRTLLTTGNSLLFSDYLGAIYVSSSIYSLRCTNTFGNLNRSLMSSVELSKQIYPTFNEVLKSVKKFSTKK